jgi:hypothetical protein
MLVKLSADGREYAVDAYDVLEICIKDKWSEYYVVKTETEARTAIGMASRHPSLYRIARNGKPI